ncbi:type II toxin-antitoxin system death-on-curing family toxin [Yinghuangia aomiensis]
MDGASARPRTTAFGADAYPDVWTKAAALMHAIARGHPLVDGNKRTSWVAARVFPGPQRRPGTAGGGRPRRGVRHRGDDGSAG